MQVGTKRCWKRGVLGLVGSLVIPLVATGCLEMPKLHMWDTTPGNEVVVPPKDTAEADAIAEVGGENRDAEVIEVRDVEVWTPEICTADCNGKKCGPDGCGGDCGTCSGSQDECIDGTCQCQPACNGKKCGPDGCGGACTCPFPDQKCVGGLCETTCLHDCGGEVLIPAGNFWMGCNEAVDTECLATEYPYHEVYLDGYYIDRTEVTVDAYSACVTAGGCTAPSTSHPYCNWGVALKGSDPVNCVTWYQVDEYCAWAGKRLPTEAEWEKAARGTDGRKYPWGNETATCDYAVMNDSTAGGNGCGTDSTWPVCSKSPAGDSPFGLCDMAGNVWEWTADWHLSNYYTTSPASNPTGPIIGSYRVNRGGCFYYEGFPLRVSNRYGDDPSDDVFGAIGFRCARAL